MDDERGKEGADRELGRARARMAELEAALQETDARFRTVLEGAFEGLMVSVAGTIIEANDACAALVGLRREQVIGKTVADFTSPQAAARILEHIRSGSEAPYEVEILRPDGTSFPCEIRGRNVSFRGQAARITALRDLTQRKQIDAEKQRAAEQMLHAQKVETLCVVVGGVAHDFNNMLLVVLGHAELGLALVTDPKLQVHFAQIRSAALRASDFVKQMLTYAGRAEAGRGLVDLGALIAEDADLLRTSVGKQAVLVLEVPPTLPAVKADAGQLRQVLVNLLANAAEALPGSSGRVALRANEVALDAARLGAMTVDATSGAGRFVALEVEDDGSGMDAATLARMFDPFFSTKFPGRGLGLASVLGVVRAHSGAIDVKSALERGTRVAVYLPVTDPSPTRSSEPKAVEKASGARGRVLLVDDEHMLRLVGAEILRFAGYEVVTAEDGRVALEIFRARPEQFDIMVLDATMPNLSGPETLAELRRTHPHFPVIMVSGFQDPSLRADFGDEVSFLAKPFETDALIAEIERMLSR